MDPLEKLREIDLGVLDGRMIAMDQERAERHGAQDRSIL